MSFLDIFRSNQNESLHRPSGQQALRESNIFEAQVAEGKGESGAASPERKEHTIHLLWGTGMPIDVIYDFLNSDFETQGYEDAMANDDVSYRNTKEEVIINNLKVLMRRILLRYQDENHRTDMQMKNAEAACALSTVELLHNRQQTFLKHIEEIENMQRQLNERAPQMMAMINSYRCGFMKGIAAKASTAFTQNY